jgi:hypothetical protein
MPSATPGTRYSRILASAKAASASNRLAGACASGALPRSAIAVTGTRKSFMVARL